MAVSHQFSWKENKLSVLVSEYFCGCIFSFTSLTSKTVEKKKFQEIFNYLAAQILILNYAFKPQ